MPTSLYCPVAW